MDAGIEMWSLETKSGAYLTFQRVSLLKEENDAYYDGGRHPLLKGYGGGMGCATVWELNPAASQLPGKRKGAMTKGDLGGMLSADLPIF